MTMKSTPSAFSTAGVGRFGSGPNTLAMNLPYTKYPSTRAKTLKRNEYIVLSIYASYKNNKKAAIKEEKKKPAKKAGSCAR